VRLAWLRRDLFSFSRTGKLRLLSAEEERLLQGRRRKCLLPRKRGRRKEKDGEKLQKKLWRKENDLAGSQKGPLRP